MNHTYRYDILCIITSIKVQEDVRSTLYGLYKNDKILVNICIYVCILR